jgi:YD repeat-containing protein
VVRTTQFEYNDANELVSVSDPDAECMARQTNLDHLQGETDLAGHAFTYDAASRITEIDSLIDGLTTYSYDTTIQLTAADFATQTDETHVSDANGNPEGASFEVGANNQVLSDGKFDYMYDDEGSRTLRVNIATGESTEYVWDHRNRLVNVITGDDEQNILQDVQRLRLPQPLDQPRDRRRQAMRRALQRPNGSPTTVTSSFSPSTTPKPRSPTSAGRMALRSTSILPRRTPSSIRDTALWDAVEEETVLKKHTLYTSFNAVASHTDDALASLIGGTGRPHDPATGLDNHLNR